jgi:hypothetical protein
VSAVPLPFTCQHKAYRPPGAVNGHGNAVDDWAAPVDVACVWWTPMSESRISSEPDFAPTGGDPAVIDLRLVVGSSLVVDQRDQFVIEGITFEAIGRPRDYNKGPWKRPDLLVIDLKAVV